MAIIVVVLFTINKSVESAVTSHSFMFQLSMVHGVSVVSQMPSKIFQSLTWRQSSLSLEMFIHSCFPNKARNDLVQVFTPGSWSNTAWPRCVLIHGQSNFAQKRSWHQIQNVHHDLFSLLHTSFLEWIRKWLVVFLHLNLSFYVALKQWPFLKFVCMWMCFQLLTLLG